MTQPTDRPDKVHHELPHGAEAADEFCEDCGYEPVLKRSLGTFQVFAIRPRAFFSARRERRASRRPSARLETGRVVSRSTRRT